LIIVSEMFIMALFRGILAMGPHHRLSPEFLACSFLVSVRARPAEHYEVTVERGVPAKMRDGAILRADWNLNSGPSLESGARSVEARNTAYHNREHPSALILPVVPQ
jgi:predicted acyl esterase